MAEILTNETKEDEPILESSPDSLNTDDGTKEIITNEEKDDSSLTPVISDNNFTEKTGTTIDRTVVLPASDPNVSDRNWVTTTAFSSTDADTVSWGAGTFTSADGTAYSIDAGNTGNMTAKTYIYLDTNVSETEYQTTTTATDAVGAGKVLVAIAEDSTGEATFLVLNDESLNIDAANIVANSITANELSTSITYAGSIVIDTAGNIRSGQTAFDTGTGWFIGNDGGTPKFSIGDSTGNKVTWDGTDLTIKPGFTTVADGTDVTVGNTDTETTLVTIPIEGGSLGTSGGVQLRMFWDDIDFLNSNQDCDIKVKYGSTTMIDTDIKTIVGSGQLSGGKAMVHVDLVAVNSASSQEASFDLSLASNSDGDPARVLAKGSASENSANDLDLVITVDWLTARADNSIRMSYYIATGFNIG